ncbi:MAG: hypothetical protein C3F11_19840 [Methylocystaceae bacterium]|nr:MAG: hypothetical protein C3F11_19840 [Methylocystaceae bacterium]
MLRLSRSRIINDIEFIVDRPIAGVGPLRWETKGVECIAERHAYRGQTHSFDLDVMRVRLQSPSRSKWELLIVTEYWRGAEGENIHTTKWLKLTVGKKADVAKWIAVNREPASRKQASTDASSPVGR